MDIVYQYYNEVVLAFRDFDTDFRDSVIIIHVPEDKKPFDVVCDKIVMQLDRIAETLDLRDKDIVVRIQRSDLHREIRLERQ